MKVFLDDIRMPAYCSSYMEPRIGPYSALYKDQDWIVVRNYRQFIHQVEKHAGLIMYVSFDYDLEFRLEPDVDETFPGTEFSDYVVPQENSQPTGYDCARWLKEFYKDNNFEMPLIIVHSMNPVGRQRILDLFKDTSP